MQRAALPTRQATGSGAAGGSGSRHRRRRFPQALGASLPWRGAAAAGPPPGRALARQAALRGKRVAVLPPEAYGGYKDINEAWAAGVLRISDWPAAEADGAEGIAVPEKLQEAWAERVAIMVVDGGLPRAEAERLAWAEIQAAGAVL